MEPGEKIVHMEVTSKYNGFMIFAFENGKAAKVDMQGYATKTNRRKLTGAYNTKSPLCGIFHIDEDTDITLLSAGGRGLIINSSLIPAKAKRDTQGVQVYLSKRDKKLANAFIFREDTFENPGEYKSSRIPSSGQRLKDVDLGAEQTSFFD
jgi:DNA gyrase subunit A